MAGTPKWNGETHPAADDLPMMSEDQLRALADDIGTNGLGTPGILLPDGRLLDGRNREAACRMAGVEMEWVIEDPPSPYAKAASLNFHRRQLTKQGNAKYGAALMRGINAEGLERMAEGGRRSKPNTAAKGEGELRHLSDGGRAPKSSERAAEILGNVVSATTIAHYARIQQLYPDLAAEVDRNERTVDNAYKELKEREEMARGRSFLTQLKDLTRRLETKLRALDEELVIGRWGFHPEDWDQLPDQRERVMAVIESVRTHLDTLETHISGTRRTVTNTQCTRCHHFKPADGDDWCARCIEEDIKSAWAEPAEVEPESPPEPTSTGTPAPAPTATSSPTTGGRTGRRGSTRRGPRGKKAPDHLQRGHTFLNEDGTDVLDGAKIDPSA
jgi:hypothetical protein